MCFAVISAEIWGPVISGVDKFAPVGVANLKFALNYLIPQIETNKENVQVAKGNAGDTGTSQPCDVSHVHDAVKKTTDSLLQHPEYVSEPQYLWEVEGFLAKMAKGHRKTYVAILRVLPHVLSKPMNTLNVCSGWRVSGYRPYDARQMFSKYPLWNLLSQQEAVLETTCNELTDIAMEEPLTRQLIVQKLGASLLHWSITCSLQALSRLWYHRQTKQMQVLRSGLSGIQRASRGIHVLTASSA